MGIEIDSKGREETSGSLLKWQTYKPINASSDTHRFFFDPSSSFFFCSDRNLNVVILNFIMRQNDVAFINLNKYRPRTVESYHGRPVINSQVINPKPQNN